MFSRVLDQIREWLHRLKTTGVRDAGPEEYLNRAYLEIQNQLADTRRATAAALGQEKRLLLSIEEQQRQIRECEDRAVEALRHGREEQARLEMDRKVRLMEYEQTLQEEYSRRHRGFEELRTNLRLLQERTETARQKREILLGRLRRPESRSIVRNLIRELGDISTADAFDRLEELSRPVAERNPEREVAALTAPTAAEMLEELKEKLRRDEKT